MIEMHCTIIPSNKRYYICTKCVKGLGCELTRNRSMTSQPIQQFHQKLTHNCFTTEADRMQECEYITMAFHRHTKFIPKKA